ncbi:hypothetical protein POSPLADRAFT_1132831 [Postia placenta MAD-698-R-SB12]|uniref:NAD(P)-binding protein n=1 Tax=Postia placenta MAD-698-R-SB12 TaxID=670580 RepID=A0A1X6NDK8_9APHY|nr:hypothetical protein POSPLADRAFT_1132831 [Postia placenta MAD-698-R-SB12]OSX66725.1 hypothetical protein POSPLADRAFT_1132831 [Postia placenta MAD-698-R-SB12]
MAPDLFSFSNRVALITGGGSGIGAYVAKGLAETGASRVYIIGRRVAGVEATTQAAPNVIIPIVGDVGTSEGCRKIVEAFEGGEKKAGIDAADIRLDLLFNNAGIAHEEGAWGPGATPEQVRDALLKASDTDWAHEFAVNVSSVQWMSALLLPHLVRASKQNNGARDGRGCIVINSSVSAFYYSSPVHVYAASKAAAHSVTQSLASKFTRLGVRVNSIAPANVPSEMNNPDDPRSFISQRRDVIPIGRIGSGEDVVGTVLYLASRAGSYISGTVILVSEGQDTFVKVDSSSIR